MAESSIIRGDLSKILAHNIQDGCLHVDKALSVMMAYLDDPSHGSSYLNADYAKCKDSILSSVIRSKNRLSVMSFPDKCALLHEAFTMQDLEQKRLFVSKLMLDKFVVDISEPEGFLSFRDTTLNAYLSMTKVNGSDIDKYVWKAAVLDLENDSPAKAPAVNPSATKRGEKPATKKNLAKTVYADFIDKLRAAHSITEDPKWGWQWKITTAEFQDMKSLVDAEEWPTRGTLTKEGALFFALYLGECYKRTTEDMGGQCRKGFLPAIIEKQGNKIPLYQKNNNSWLYSIYVYGGLPIYALDSKIRSGSSNQFVRALARVLSPAEELDVEIGALQLTETANTAIRESYVRHHSIWDYINQIDQIIADMKDEYPDFCRMASEGLESASRLRNKFRVRYEVWTEQALSSDDLDVLNVKPIITFAPECDGERHFAISEDLLRRWGVTSPVDSFVIKLNDETDKELFACEYWICFNGDYIERRMKTSVALPELTKSTINWPKLILQDYNYVYHSETEEKVVSSAGQDASVIQLYTSEAPEAAMWTSFKGNRTFVRSSLLFNTADYEPIDQSWKCVDADNNVGWVEFRYCLTMRNVHTGKLRTFYNSKGQITAVPTADSISKIMKSPLLANAEGMVLPCTNTRTGRAYLVKRTGLKFAVQQSCSGDEISADVCDVTYWDGTNWKPYDKKQPLPLGHVVFRVTFAAYSDEVDCFVLEDAAELALMKNAGLKKFVFKNTHTESMKITLADSTLLTPINDRYEAEDKGKKGNVDFVFSVDGTDCQLVLTCFGLGDSYQILLDGQPITDKKIPAIYAAQCDVQVADEEGMRRLNVSKNVFNSLTRTATGNSTSTPAVTIATQLKLDCKKEQYVNPFTASIDDSTCSSSADFWLLDWNANSVEHIPSTADPVKQYAKNRAKDAKHDFLLFQSLKGVLYCVTYYQPEFISRNGKTLRPEGKQQDRQDRLLRFVNHNTPEWMENTAVWYFELACEHQMYFACFDNLLSIVAYLDDRTPVNFDLVQSFFAKGDKKKNVLRKRMLEFLSNYLLSAKKRKVDVNVDGLNRMAAEFGFSWQWLTDNQRKKIKIPTELMNQLK